MRKQTAPTHQSCMDAAFRCLSYRPRSEFEIRTRLESKGFDEGSVRDVLLKLRKQGLVDDLAFARFWTSNRCSFNPRGRAMLRSELRRKGIAPDIIAEVVQEVDETASAYAAAQKKLSRLTGLDYNAFRRKLGAFLNQRGFTYEVAQHTVTHLWQERNKDA
jgi:regulatory protein